MRFTYNVWICLVAALVGVTALGRAQSAPCPPITGEPYLRCQVDRAAVADTNNPAPRYPDMLRQARFSGSSRVSFVVDSSGRVDLESLAVLEARHDLFVQAVRLVLPRWTFKPAQKNEASVAMRYDQMMEA